MATNDVLDRLEKLLAPSVDHCHRSDERHHAANDALRNAAPALIRLARAAMRVDPSHCLTTQRDEFYAAIKALGEVEL